MEPYRYPEELTMKAALGASLGVLGVQPRLVTTAIFPPWDHFFDQGEQVFEVVFLVLWFAFVVFLVCSAVRFVRENPNKKTKSTKKRRDRPASPTRRLR